MNCDLIAPDYWLMQLLQCVLVARYRFKVKSSIGVGQIVGKIVNRDD
jgi:hypothetical protein